MSEQPYSYQPAAPPTSGLAIGSLIASILGLTFLPTIGSIIGVVLGYMAKRQIAESGGTMGGEGLAKAGIIIGWVGIGLTALAICLWIALLVLGVGGSACVSLGNIQ